MGNVDGSIKIGVDLEPKDAKKALLSLKKTLYDAFTAKNTGVFEKSTKTTNKEIKSLEQNIDKLQKKLSELNSDSVEPKSVQNMRKELQGLEKELQAANTEFDKYKTEYASLQERNVTALGHGGAESGRISELDGLLAQSGSKVDGLYTKIDALKTKIEHLKANPELTEEAQRYSRELDETVKSLENLRQIQSKQQSEAVKGSGFVTQALNDSTKSLSRFGRRMGSLTASALVFSVVTKALTILRNSFGAALMTNKEFANSLSQIKGNLLTAFMPIYQYILPALNSLMSALARVTAYIAAFVNALFGKSVKASEKSAKSLKSQADAYGSAGKAAKKAAEEAERSMLSFDELNVINSPKSENSDTGGGGGAGTDAMPINPSIDTSIVDEVKKSIDSLELLLSTAFLALGAILFFTGANRGLGLGLLAVGAMMLAKQAKEDWGKSTNQVSTALMSLEIIVSAGLLALGALLVFSGANIPLGIALLAIGAISLAGAIAISWNSASDQCKLVISSLMAFVGAALLAVGALLVFTGGNVPLGIALLAMGALAIASAVALAWNTDQTIKDKIDSLTLIIGGAALVLGAFLTFSGINVPLGIGLLALGAASLITSLALSWNSADDKVREKVLTIGAIVGGAMLAVGALLALSGVNIPLGLALIAAGAVTLVGAVSALNWNKISSKVKEIINGIIALVEKGVNKIISLLNGISFDIPDWVPAIGGKTFGFNIKKVNIPRLATGAVIPPNKEFLAVLGDQKSGTNIETPLDTMLHAFNTALDSRGDTREIVIRFEGTLAQLVRLLKPELDKESSRKGVKLVKGGAY